MKEKILCTICARGGSKGVKNKNIKLVAGHPLIAHSIMQAKSSGLFQAIVISTDSDEIAKVAQEYGAEVFFKRTAELASDTAGKLDVIRDAFLRSETQFQQEYDYLIDIDATSPLREVADIVNVLNMLKKDEYENIITATPSRRSPYFNMLEMSDDGRVTLCKKSKNVVLRRQDAPQTFDMNASIYGWTRSSILTDSSAITDTTGLYIMPEDRSLDIDSPLDFDIVSFILNQKNQESL